MPGKLSRSEHHIISYLEHVLSTNSIFRRNLDHDKRIFNYRLSRARRIVENAFGRLAAVWRIYRRPINVEPHRADSIVLATCALQNFVLTHRTIPFTTDTDAYIRDGTWRQLANTGMRRIGRRQRGNNPGTDPKDVQTKFRLFFNGAGAVEWQERMIALAEAVDSGSEDD